jgi:protein-tyrosine phosphatase
MKQNDMAERFKKITEMYRTHLKREPDGPGMEDYLKSSLSIKEIEQCLLTSQEYLDTERLLNFKTNVEVLGKGELLLMGSTPRSEDDIKTLISMDVQAVLNLDSTTTYDSTCFKQYLNVPIEPKKPMSEEIVRKCLVFIKENVVERGKKTFIHSERGLERAPMILTLFLVAERGMPFGVALRIVLSKQKIVSPGRELLNSSLLEYVIHMRKEFGAPDNSNIRYTLPSVVPPTQSVSKVSEGRTVVASGKMPNIKKVSEKLYVGSVIDDTTLASLFSAEVKTIMDTNEGNVKINSSTGQKFSIVKLPMIISELNSLLPVLVKSSRKFMGRGPLYLFNSNPGILAAFLTYYASNLEPNDVIGISDPMKLQMSLMG